MSFVHFSSERQNTLFMFMAGDSRRNGGLKMETDKYRNDPDRMTVMEYVMIFTIVGICLLAIIFIHVVCGVPIS